MQITVFFIAYTKKSTMLSLRALISRSVRVVYKLHYFFLAQVKETQFWSVLLHTLFLEYKAQIDEKNTGQCFSIELQFTCITSDKSEKNRKTA